MKTVYQIKLILSRLFLGIKSGVRLASQIFRFRSYKKELPPNLKIWDSSAWLTRNLKKIPFTDFLGIHPWIFDDIKMSQLRLTTIGKPPITIQGDKNI